MIHPSPSPLREPLAQATLRRSTQRLQVVLVGDSTVCDQALDSPYRGWGQHLSAALCERAQVFNRAKSGASTKTFRDEGLWHEVLELRPDWVIIQFGHNDSHSPEKPESTRAKGEYAANLRRFITDLRTHSAHAILVTPVRRFHFDEDGRLCEGEAALEPYARAMREVGREMQVPVVDLFASSTRLFQWLGPQASNRLSPAPGEDFSHFNEAGARLIAQLVMRDLADVAPLLWDALFPRVK